jgi:hypothetical protein
MRTILLDGRATIEPSEVRANAPIAPAIFAQPARPAR